MIGRVQTLALTLAVLGVFSVPVAGCSCGRESAAPAEVTPLPAVPAAAVHFTLDGASSSELDTSNLGGRDARVDLETRLPAGAPPRAEWRQLTARGGARFVELTSMQRLYPDHQLALYRDAEGRACFGAFRRGTPEMPLWMRQKLAEPVIALVGVESIELRTRERPPAPAADTLEVVRSGGVAVVLDEAKIQTLSTIKPLAGVPGEGRKRGYALGAVLGLAVDPKELLRVREVVVSAGAESRRFTGAELRSDAVVPVLKRNRKGVWKLLVYRRVGASDELSPVRRIEIDPPRVTVPAVPPSASPQR